MNDKPNENQAFYALLLGGLIILLVAFWNFLLRLAPKVSKSVVADSYDVKVRTLMKWVKFFCPEHLSEHMVGKKTQKIHAQQLIKYLGSAKDYPLSKKGKVLNKRDALHRAFDIGQDTLSRFVKGLEQPEQTIGMSLHTYQQLRRFPPLQSRLLVNALLEKYPMKR